MDGHSWWEWHETRDSYGRRFPPIHDSFSSIGTHESSTINNQYTESASIPSYYSKEATPTPSYGVLPTQSSVGPGTFSTSIPLGTSPTSSTLIEPEPSKSRSVIAPPSRSNTMSTSMPSTFDTSTISSTFSRAPSQTSTTALPDTFHAHRKSLTSGTLAAAIVVPVLFALLLAALAIMFLRGRSRRSGSTTQAFLPAMKEVFSEFTVQKSPPAPPASQLPPVVTSQQNNAYYTGLDTSSQGSRGQSGEYYGPARRSEGGTFVEPPPPYKTPPSLNSERSEPETIPEAPSTAAIPAHQSIPQLREPSPEPDADRSLSPFDDHEAVESIPDVMLRTTQSGRLLSPIERPQASRSTTAHSFASTLYSENASVHDAIAARMSVGSAMIVGSTPSREREARSRQSPFEDPTATPMSEVDNLHDMTTSWMSDVSSVSDIGLAR